MERRLDVATGESVAFSYELAGLGSRFLALAIDLAIQIGIAFAAVAILAWIGSGVPRASAVKTESDPALTRFVVAVLIGIAVFAAFLLFFGYFIIFEWRWGGRTPGKRMLGIRVVRDGGFPLDFTASVVRNVVRLAELGLGFYAVSAIATVLSPANRRLGDMAAGTIVVRDNRFERLTASGLRERLDAADLPDRDDAVVRDLGEAERDLVRRYAARRETLPVAARVKLAATIAAVVRPKLAASFAHLDDDDLLVHVARTALR